MNWFTRLFNPAPPIAAPLAEVMAPAPIKKGPVTLPGGRVSYPDTSSLPTEELSTNLKLVKPMFEFDVIPVIRKLCIANADMGQALHNLVTLGNTGHDIHFDPRVTPEQMDKMRSHINAKRNLWSVGCAGADGLVNKMMSQIIIGGASSGEWVPDLNLKTIKQYIFVNPENIRFVYDNNLGIYVPYQKVPILVESSKNQLIKLNTETFKYFGLNVGSDTEVPYGIPPYIASLDPISDQRMMKDNIKYIIQQLGIMGFLEVKMDKPDQNDGETDAQYLSRLESMLDSAKARILMGFRDGTTVGFKDDHEFEFHQTVKNYQGVKDIYETNELDLFSGLKTDAALQGRGYATSETQIGVVFNKALSELKNVQNIIKAVLEFGYSLELRLAGFKFESLEVRFKYSTLVDDYKYQQAQEIKIRNVNNKYNMGIINQDKVSDELGYEKPDSKTPRIKDYVVGSKPTEKTEPGDAKKNRKNTKKKSEKKTRESSK